MFDRGEVEMGSFFIAHKQQWTLHDGGPVLKCSGAADIVGVDDLLRILSRWGVEC